jgi:hypothetical protein
LCFSSDLWESIADDCILGMTFHFIDGLWMLRTKTVALKNIIVAHTIPNLKKAMDEVLSQWEATSKVIEKNLSNVFDILSNGIYIRIF